ncbi:UspA domain protein [Dehalogenimonas lykanthroporepellens BL-DC-9]|jgi:nucleotide-binding universal stress UspA family protein|nr:UspA domain protein [Dehalogenimonas lykanthroporepellens BL-DC-9]
MFKSILVPLDGSALAESILPQAVAIAEPAGAEVTLLRVIEPLDKGVRETMGRELAARLDEVTIEEAQAYLDGIAGKLTAEGLSVRSAVITGQPAQAIIEYVGAHAVNLIVMASHGRSGLSRWAFGSVTDKVLHRSPVPVMVGPVPGSNRG